MNGRYNPKLFFLGFLMNVLGKFPLLLAAFVLALIGIKSRVCGCIAFGILILTLVWSLLQQIRIKYTVEHSHDSDFEPFAKAMTSENWGEEINGIVEQRIRESDEIKGSRRVTAHPNEKPTEEIRFLFGRFRFAYRIIRARRAGRPRIPRRQATRRKGRA